MNIKELEKIIFQLRRYDLLGQIQDIRKWILSLNEKQINNLLNLDIKLNNYLLSNKKLIINYDFLLSDYYLEDLKLLSNINNLDTINALVSVIFNETAKKSLYYSKNKYLLLKITEPIKLYCIKNLITNEEFINLIYSYEILEIIKNANTLEAYLIYLVVVNNLYLEYDELISLINKILCKSKQDDVIIYNEKSVCEKNIKRKNEDELYEMMYKVKAYTDDDKKDVTRLILK